MEKTSELSGHFVALVTILIWGVTFVATKILLEAFTPVEILFIRFLLGFAVLWIVYPKFMGFGDFRREGLLMGAGFCGVTLYFLFENIALTYTLASNVGVLVSVAPFFTAIIAWKFLNAERLAPIFFVGFACAIAGISMIYFNGVSVFKLNPAGDALAILAAFVWAVYSVLIKRIGEYGLNTIMVTRRAFFYGLAFMLPVLCFSGFSPSLTALSNPRYLLNIMFLGLGASAVCFVTWNFSVKRLGAVKTSVYIYLVPVVSVVSAAIVLREKITWLAALGTALTLAGLVISEFGAKIGNPCRRRPEKD
jgi:drug/metabolite transporter (DMT)-like permease